MTSETHRIAAIITADGMVPLDVATRAAERLVNAGYGDTDAAVTLANTVWMSSD